MPFLLFFWLTDPLTLVYLFTFIKGTCLLNDKLGKNWGIRLKGEEGACDLEYLVWN